MIGTAYSLFQIILSSKIPLDKIEGTCYNVNNSEGKLTLNKKGFMYSVAAFIVFFVAAGSTSTFAIISSGCLGFLATFRAYKEMKEMGFFYNE